MRSAPAGLVRRVLEGTFPTLDVLRSSAPIIAPAMVAAILLVLPPLIVRATSIQSIRPGYSPTARLMWDLAIPLALVGPLTMLLRAAILSALLATAIWTLGGTQKISQTLSILLYGEVILALKGAVIALAIYFQAAPINLFSLDIVAIANGILSLGSGISDNREIIQHLGILSLCWALFLFICLRNIWAMSRRASIMCTAVVWMGMIAWDTLFNRLANQIVRSLLT